MPFPDLTPETAPPEARRALKAVTERLGYRPAAVARLAASPHTLDGFLKLSAIFESCTLNPLSREVLIMTVATRNDCHVCVAMHTAKLTAMAADPTLITALRDRSEPPLPDQRLEAVRRFTLAVLASAGAVDDAVLRDFLPYGYTEQNALEVVLGIGTYTLSTLANRLTGAPVDAPLAAFA
ncbi:carboxymuconolactone decarboxylase family protein [Streptomyces sp. NPDC059452]|uniref:carboxymuconolactone decarboxylase family protein n=1 Tax=Streptomyces sp. NPDC059452 TaxID=3346835 RepID=UPI0036C86787